MDPDGMAISADGRRLAMTQLSGGVAVFELPSGRILGTWLADAQGGSPAFSPDGSVLATRSTRELLLWPVESASASAAAAATGAAVESLDFSSLELRVEAPGWVSSPVTNADGTRGEQALRASQGSGSAIMVTLARTTEAGQSCGTITPSPMTLSWLPPTWIGQNLLACLPLAEGVLTARLDVASFAGVDYARVYELLEAVRGAAVGKWGAP